jgi:glycosyltransferase involved in cell wall biosynthesis
MPKASIIIATRNRSHLLPRAIGYARASGGDVQVVVVDDASSDETAKTCQSDSNITYVRVERKRGVAGARNVGLAASQGEYISFLDDDDVRFPNSLDQQIAVLDKDPSAALIYAQANPEDPDGKQHPPYPTDCPQGDVLWELLTRNFIPCGSAVFRRACLSQVGLLDDSIPGIDDWDLWIRIAETFQVLAIKTPVMIWRQSTPTSGQVSSRTVDLIEHGRHKFRQDWLKLPRVANAPRNKKREAWRGFSNNFSEHLIWEAFSAVNKFELPDAGKSALTALRLHPTALLSVLQQWMSAATVNTLVSSVRRREDLTQAKEHFKRLRSSKTW